MTSSKGQTVTLTRAGNLCEPSKNEKRSSRLCPLFFVLGLICVGLGFIGAVIPGLPTTVFLIMAVWCFSRSSEKFKTWLMDHPRFGPALQAWHATKSIPRTAKIAAVTSMLLSLSFTALVVAQTWVLPTVLASIMMPIAVWIVTRPSTGLGIGPRCAE